METRKLRDIKVSEVGMGCMAFSHGYGKIPPESYSIEAIRGAYEHGYTFFDTAEVYGPNLSPLHLGHNERIAGNQPIIDLLARFAAMKGCTSAQVSLAWMLHK